MAFVAAKDLFFSIDGNDISVYCKSLESKRSVDSIDTTTFGSGGHTYLGGMTDGSISVNGSYDNTSSGPKAVVEPLMATGLLVPAVYRPEGTGTGKPEQTCNVLVTTYTESSEVAGIIQWSSEMQISGPVTNTDQA